MMSLRKGTGGCVWGILTDASGWKLPRRPELGEGGASGIAIEAAIWDAWGKQAIERCGSRGEREEGSGGVSCSGDGK
jgi:hypothetical protein